MRAEGPGLVGRADRELGFDRRVLFGIHEHSRNVVRELVRRHLVDVDRSDGAGLPLRVSHESDRLALSHDEGKPRTAEPEEAATDRVTVLSLESEEIDAFEELVRESGPSELSAAFER